MTCITDNARVRPGWRGRWPLAHGRLRGTDQPLATLLGHTRARVLRAARDGCSTTELSRRADISIASASRHAAVLRTAGLLTARRYGTSVVHRHTPLGAALLARDAHLAGAPAARP